MPLEMESFVPAKEWAKRNLPPDNELRAAMLAEPDIGPRFEVNTKLAAYYKVLSAKVKLMRQ